MRRLRLSLGAALLVLCASTAGAQSLPPLPPPPARYFNDEAGLVDAQTAARLDEKLRRFDQESSGQVVVVVFPELPWPSLEDYTVRVAQSWRVGRKELDNGVVLFVFVKDRAVRVEVGYGLEGALPDALAKRIIEERIVPQFREGRYAAGLEAGVDAIIAATRGEYTAPPPSRRRRGNGWVTLAVIAGLLLLNFLLARRMARGRYVTYHRRGRRSGWASPWYWGGGGWGGGGRGGGGGGGFGGGGFSGGGGSFGGGGASGRW